MSVPTQQQLDEALQRCADEPIHQVGLIQPHGGMLVVGADPERTVLQISENLAEFVDLPAGDVLGKPLAMLIGMAAKDKVERLIARAGHRRVATSVVDLICGQRAVKLQLRGFASDEVFVLELTHDDGVHLAEHLTDLLLPMQQALLNADVEHDALQYMDRIASLTHTLTGFDRVMIYRFDQNWDGEVIAEKRDPALHSYLRLRFPASDIPPQARQLYLANPVRLVVDVGAESVPLHPACNPVTRQPLDMTHASLRCFSPVHVEYLRNMGVQASMSISLLQNGRLWGLIACHHMTPKPVSNALQEAATLISQMASAKLSSMESHERLSMGGEVSAIIGSMLKDIAQAKLGEILQTLHPLMLELLEATGLVVVVEGQVYRFGDTPDTATVQGLLDWLGGQPEGQFFACDDLPFRHLPSEAVADVVSGLLASPVTPEMRNCILWLRKERVRTVNWAGSPQKMLDTDAAGRVRLSPRTSFETWAESWRGRSVPWSPVETESASLLSRALCAGLAQKSLLEKELGERKQAEADLRIAAIAFESQEGKMLTDARHIILKVNRAFCEISGYSPQEVVGQTPRILRSGHHDAAFYEAMNRALAEDNRWSGEVWNRRKDGKLYLQWLNISVVTDEAGQVSNYVASMMDITEHREVEENLHRLSFYDQLTELPNRRLALERLRMMLLSTSRQHKHGAVLILDLDEFKIINDTRGHDAGDHLLTEVGKRLQTCVRSDDTIARLGGDEFLILLDDLSEEHDLASLQVRKLAEKLGEVINRPFNIQGEEFFSSPSIGITLFNDESASAEELLKRSDSAMYQAKKAGRNTYCFFDPHTQAALESRAMIEAWMRRASAEQYVLYYQLQVRPDGSPVGAEALIRWAHPEYGMISPASFIPLAEETGLILQIGQWVMESACQCLKHWESDDRFKSLELAVNVSSRQFRQDDFVEQVRGILQSTGAPPNRLKLELTESMVLEDVQDTILKMQALKETGVRFSMDDFGTGYSSLAYLTQLPLDQLKIDQSFVRNIGVQPTDAVIVQTIIGMALNLGFDVIAEGVETQEQREFLQVHGCLAYQGYLFSKPIPLSDFEALLGS